MPTIDKEIYSRTTLPTHLASRASQSILLIAYAFRGENCRKQRTARTKYIKHLRVVIAKVSTIKTEIINRKEIKLTYLEIIERKKKIIGLANFIENYIYNQTAAIFRCGKSFFLFKNTGFCIIAMIAILRTCIRRRAGGGEEEVFKI